MKQYMDMYRGSRTPQPPEGGVGMLRSLVLLAVQEVGESSGAKDAMLPEEVGVYQRASRMS